MKRPDKGKERAKNEIERLFSLAKERGDSEISSESIKLANKISQKFRIRLSPELKRKFCKKCFSYYVPGKNSIVRIDKGRVAYHCKICGNIAKYPYAKEQKSRRKA